MTMNSPTESIRLNGRAREQLTRLKRFTGIEHWNILARWAFCLSLKDPAPPAAVSTDKTSGIEISWRIFAGEQSSVYSALFWLWVKHAELKTSDTAELVNRHIQRGLGILEASRLEHIEDVFTTISTN